MSTYTQKPDVLLFHGNTLENVDGNLTVLGGRTFYSVALDTTFFRASTRATEACKNVILTGTGSQYRTDLGWKRLLAGFAPGQVCFTLINQTDKLESILLSGTYFKI